MHSRRMLKIFPETRSTYLDVVAAKIEDSATLVLPEIPFFFTVSMTSNFEFYITHVCTNGGTWEITK